MNAPAERAPARAGGPLVLALSALALLAPGFFLQWLTPGLSDLRISMDYPRVSAPQQQELLFSIVHGSFPLFVPGFAGGQSAGALTAGQAYHPLTYLAALHPDYWSGGAQEVNTLLRLLSLGAANLLLYRLLRRLVRGELVALLLATATVFNLRMLNVFHGAAALEGFTGHLFTVVALGWCCLRPAAWAPRIGVVVGTYCTVVSGHPQFAYFSLLGTVLAALLMPDLVRGARGEPAPTLAERLRFWMHAAALAALGGALGAAYALPFQLDFMSTNMRVGRDYGFSLWWGDELGGALNNFFRPLQAATSVSFGGSVLALVAALAPLLLPFGVRLPRYALAAWTAFLVVFLHSLGDLTPVHRFFWEYVPLFGSVRGPGRLTVVAPFLILVVLIGVFRARRPERGPFARVAPTALLAGLALVASVVHWLLPEAWTLGTMHNTPARFNAVEPSVELGIFLAGVVALLALAAHGQLRSGARVAARGPLLASALLLFAGFAYQTRTALRHGTWIEDQRAFPTLEQMRADKRERLTFRGSPGGGLYSQTVLDRLEHSCLDPVLGRLYVNHVGAEDNAAAWALLDAGRPRDTLVLETELADRTDGRWSSERLELTYASFNRVDFLAEAVEPAWLEVTFPFSDRWRAWVDGAPAELLRANGSHLAVRVPGGASEVVLRYVSRAAELGMLASCLALLALGTCIAFGALAGRARWLCLGLFTAAAAGGFAWWRAGLYHGDSLETEFVWTPPPADEPLNLAFQRPNRMTPIYPVTWNDTQATGRTPDPWGSGNGVDGLRTGRAFRTTIEPDPHWTVDLAGSPRVAEVAVFGGRLGPEPDARLELALWSEGAWKVVDRTDRLNEEEHRFRFAPVPASRVRLQVRGSSGLTAAEVEVYGP